MEDDEDMQTKKRRLTDNDSEEGKRHAQSLYVGENVTTCTLESVAVPIKHITWI